MCGTCPEFTATETAEDRARRASLNTAAITTNDGSIDIQSKSGKDICFSEAGQPKVRAHTRAPCPLLQWSYVVFSFFVCAYALGIKTRAPLGEKQY